MADDIRDSHIKLSNGLEMDIVHDLGDLLENALINWIPRCKKPIDKLKKQEAEELFCEYINSKEIHSAMPSSELEKDK